MRQSCETSDRAGQNRILNDELSTTYDTPPVITTHASAIVPIETLVVGSSSCIASESAMCEQLALESECS